MSFVDPQHSGGARELCESEADPNPLVLFRAWYEQAVAAGLLQPEAMTLATATPDGRPSARMVLLRGHDEQGFVFYTNYLSRKGVELESNPFASLVLFWPEFDRQVRVEGRVERTTAQESDRYFASRPRGHRLGAWASPQSQVIPDRTLLEHAEQERQAAFPGEEVPRPPHWGGYRVVPDVIEFWQGRANRLHDRLRYRRNAQGRWIIERLAP